MSSTYARTLLIVVSFILLAIVFSFFIFFKIQQDTKLSTFFINNTNATNGYHFVSDDRKVTTVISKLTMAKMTSDGKVYATLETKRSNGSLQKIDFLVYDNSQHVKNFLIQKIASSTDINIYNSDVVNSPQDTYQALKKAEGKSVLIQISNSKDPSFKDLKLRRLGLCNDIFVKSLDSGKVVNCIPVIFQISYYDL